MLQRTPRKGRDERDESGWSERTTGTKTMMGDKNSERRKIKAKNSTPSRLVSREIALLRRADEMGCALNRVPHSDWIYVSWGGGLILILPVLISDFNPIWSAFVSPRPSNIYTCNYPPVFFSPNLLVLLLSFFRVKSCLSFLLFFFPCQLSVKYDFL